MAPATDKPTARRTKPGKPTLGVAQKPVRHVAASVAGAAARKTERTKPATSKQAQEAELEALMRRIDKRIAARRKALDALLRRLRTPQPAT